MTNREKLIEEIQDTINYIDCMIDCYDNEVDDPQQDLYELFEQKEMLELELVYLLESVEE